MFRAPIAVLLAAVITAGGLVTPASAAAPPSILINELANGGPGSTYDSFFELRNWSDDAVDLTGWRVFRCSEQGLRANIGRQEVALTGIVLEPGGILTVSMVGMPGDMHFDSVFGEQGFGLYLESPAHEPADLVGVYPNQPWPTQSECTSNRNLPNVLNFAAGESWQRVSATGDITRDFVVAPSTLGEQNRLREEPRESTDVVISEVASFGPAAADDEFVELLNTGDAAEDIGGWELYRCIATGRLIASSHELTVPAGTMLEAGERWVIGGSGFTGETQARLEHGLADVTFGLLLQSSTGRLVDRLSVSNHADTACQDGDVKVPAILDGVAAESYQLTDDGFILAPRTPGRANARTASSVFGTEFAYPDAPGIAISELATDPSTEGMPAGSVQRNFIELGNYGSESVDIGGWTVRRCEADGPRSVALQFEVAAGTVLAPGAVYLAAREGTAAASTADTTYPTSLNFLGTGVWLEDDAGTRFDSVGVYAANEMDASNVIPSSCTLGMALTTYVPDRLLEETFQRAQFTGSNADDFLVAPATPGTIDKLAWADPTARVVTASPAAVSDAPRPRAVAHPALTLAAVVLEAWAGVTDGGPLTAATGVNETAVDAAAPAPATDAAFGYPYHRFVLDASALAPGSPVGWTGSTTVRNEVQLSVWDGAAWRLLDAGSGQPIELSGELAETDIVDGRVSLLIQDGPRTQATLATERDGQLEDPADYDFAITHITDTQYLSESYPEVYAQLTSWVADNAADRKIAFATHTGDLVQNWVDPGQNEIRARIEFERASAIQSILDDAGIPNSVLPGNHDNKRGVDNALYNEYFPPTRYEGEDWYGGSIAPGDNSSNFSTFERDGAKFLMLSLPYAYGEREIAWAEGIVTGHPEFNVIISTHEHVMPKTLEETAQRAATARWTSHAQDLWDRVIAPNRNVVVVLSGHFHGIGQLVTEDAGGIDGHTVVELLADYQEFRTHTGERATGFYRMLQVDLDDEAIAVDTRSVRLAASYSFDYDYRQFLPDDGLMTTPSNNRPWRIVESGLQGRYSEEDDEFTANIAFQRPKSVDTIALTTGSPRE